MSAQENKSTIKNIVAIVGFVILLAIGIWSAIQVIKFVPRLFSDTGVSTQTVKDNEIKLGDRDIVAELSKSTAQSGEPVTLKWAHNGDNEGILSFSYACEEGFYFQIAGRPVPCNAPYNVPASDTSLEIIPLSAKEKIDAPLAITYTNANGVSVRDTKTLVVLNDSATSEEETTTQAETEKEGTVVTTTKKGPVEAPATTATTRTTTTPKPVVRTIRVPLPSNPYGVADLRAEMVAIGDINQYGAFEGKGIVHPYVRGAVKFKVTNQGTKESGSWYFNATLPTQGGYPFNSQLQPSLMPGASTEIFMTFDQLTPGVYNFSVRVDPQNYIPELNEYNNTTGQTISVLNY